jgi:hypothetical protein
MISWVVISSVITQPYIIPRFRKYEPRCFISEIWNPCVWIWKESVLKKNCRLRAIFIFVYSYPEHPQNVPIFCCNEILIANKFLLLNYLAKRFVFVRVIIIVLLSIALQKIHNLLRKIKLLKKHIWIYVILWIHLFKL